MAQDRWTAEIRVSGLTWAGVRSSASECLKQIIGAEDYRTAITAGGGSSGYGFSININSPVEAEIAELRRRADELEARLRGSTPAVIRCGEAGLTTASGGTGTKLQT